MNKQELPPITFPYEKLTSISAHDFESILANNQVFRIIFGATCHLQCRDTLEWLDGIDNELIPSIEQGKKGVGHLAQAIEHDPQFVKNYVLIYVMGVLHNPHISDSGKQEIYTRLSSYL